ncbi:MAG: carbohydrate binding family 9 domain-containing protein [Bacteroidetes bacterium]|nr:carbohydrate binding family 9 domain-containing protein [Bacteroidota bacterium]
MKNHFFLVPFIVTCLSINSVFSQYQIQAEKLIEPIVLDGKLNESIWKKAKLVRDFTQMKPRPGNPSAKKTTVQIAYDDQAIYFGAVCYDHPDSISKVLSLRDDFAPTLDIFSIFLDTYNDNQNGFYFGVTSRGVQVDAKIAANDYNDQLNLVWNSVIHITDSAWVVEIRIPYSAFRFPKKEVQNWGVNFSRQISRLREESTWAPVNPDLENFLLESGDITNLKGIKPPVRLALMPYLSAYLDRIPQDGEDPLWTRSMNGGMDIKYGLNEAFTLDVTLVPDFGQVVFDQKVLNLSPFEVQFNENRQFFTEGTELFNKAGLFYSRRIGIQAPYSISNAQVGQNEYLVEEPLPSQLYNASKISGRMKNGLGIGFFNAITAEQEGLVLDTITDLTRSVTVSPLTNYNVFVLDQNLKNNSSITFTNTNVWRAGDFYDANVSGLNFVLNSKNNNYYVNGSGAISSKKYSNSLNLGHRLNFNIGKQRGKWVYGISVLQESNTYDPNDLGFLYNNNNQTLEIAGGYRVFKPKWDYLNRFVVGASLSVEGLYMPKNYTGTYLDGKITLVSKNFNAGGLRYDGSLAESFDYFEPRQWGSFFIRPTWHYTSLWVSSNYQKKFAIDAGVGYVHVGRPNWWEWDYRFNPRWRISDNISAIYSWDQEFQWNSQGFAVQFGQPIQSISGILFGQRNRVNTIQSMSLDYILTNRMGVTFRLRHYRSAIKYTAFYELTDNGRLSDLVSFDGKDSDGNSAYDINYNAFTIDMQFRWVFLPGSELNVVWKNSIFTADKAIQELYWMNLKNTLDNGPVNSFSLKLIYWLDYAAIAKKRK